MNAKFSEHVIIFKPPYVELGVSKNSGTPKSSILIRFSIINHPFWGTFILGNTQLYNSKALRLNSRIIEYLLGLAANCPERNTPKSDTSPSTKILPITVRSAPEKKTKKNSKQSRVFLGEFSRYKRQPQLTPSAFSS